MPLKALIESEALKVKPSKLYLAENTKSAESLERLSNDSDSDVLICAVLNPNCPAEILEKLSDNSDSDVRCSVACNPICTVENLENLAKDSNCNVRYYANKGLNRIRSAQS